MSRVGKVITAGLSIVFGFGLVPAIAATSLPGGASSLNETHDDWRVRCGVAGTKDQPVVACTSFQEQLQKGTNRRVLTIALNPADDGVTGTLIMPFGLSLDAGVTVQIDDGPASAPAKYRTCMPVGCLVSLSWNSDMVDALRKGGVLKISAASDNGQPATFSVSLKGAASALDRAIELTR